jgi:putative transposase
MVGVMPQSLSKVIVHIIFSTKDREPWLGLDVRPRCSLPCNSLPGSGAEVVRVGGLADHVHIVTTLPRTVSQAEFIERVKQNVLESHCRGCLRLAPFAGKGLR